MPWLRYLQKCLRARESQVLVQLESVHLKAKSSEIGVTCKYDRLRLMWSNMLTLWVLEVWELCRRWCHDCVICKKITCTRISSTCSIRVSPVYIIFPHLCSTCKYGCQKQCIFLPFGYGLWCKWELFRMTIFWNTMIAKMFTCSRNSSTCSIRSVHLSGTIPKMIHDS